MFGLMTRLYWSYWARVFLWSFGIFRTQPEPGEPSDDPLAEEPSDLAAREPGDDERPVAAFPVPGPPPANRPCPKCGARDMLLLDRIRLEHQAADHQRCLHEKWRCLSCGYFEQNSFAAPAGDS